MTIRKLSDERVAILEDDPTALERLSDLIKWVGGVPVPSSPSAPELVDLKDFLKNETISMLVCDHRLYEHGDYAHYTGAKAIADSYKNGFGGVLITSYEESDAESSIREYRRWIPSLIHASNLKPETLLTAIWKADSEVRKKIIERNRVPYRTIMTIQRIIETGAGKIVKVIMSQWDTKIEVGFPLHLIPYAFQCEIEPGQLLIAKVNIDTERAEELYFDDFELPDPDVLKKSQTYFNRP
jgi:hypothetical protein